VASELINLFRKRVKSLRTKEDLTQEEMAEKAGIEYKHYQSIEAGRVTNVTLKTIEKIAKALKIDAHLLIKPQ
jgi:transcriptional regulator with XRE-family HTH domain